MATYTYEQIYSDACKSIVRCEEDASIAGRHNGADCVVVCDRKWGECTPSVKTAYLKADKTAGYLTQYKISGTSESVIDSYPTGAGSNYLDLYDENGTKIPYDSSKTYTATSVMNEYGTYEYTLEIYNDVGFNNCQRGYSEAIYYLVNHNGYLAWNGVTAKNGESLPYTLNIYRLWIKYTVS